VQFVFLPLHASWLNQIELWFSVLERQCLKRARLTAHVAMTARIYAFGRHWNRTARPFRWTFKGYPLRR
jgi:transposase